MKDNQASSPGLIVTLKDQIRRKLAPITIQAHQRPFFLFMPKKRYETIIFTGLFVKHELYLSTTFCKIPSLGQKSRFFFHKIRKQRWGIKLFFNHRQRLTVKEVKVHQYYLFLFFNVIVIKTKVCTIPLNDINILIPTQWWQHSEFFYFLGIPSTPQCCISKLVLWLKGNTGYSEKSVHEYSRVWYVCTKSPYKAGRSTRSPLLLTSSCEDLNFSFVKSLVTVMTSFEGSIFIAKYISY